MIKVKDVSKVYGKKEGMFTALENINLTIPDGATLAIVGKSGSGKSTLMHVMSGLDHITAGSIIIDGKELAKLKPKAMDRFRATEMSFIFQSFFIEPNQSCYQNVMLPLEIAQVPRKKRREMVKDALLDVELESKIDTDASKLSGGQKQRLAIARAIVNKPSLIFADEPTGNLDSATGDKIMDLLFELNKTLGSTLIIVTHDHDLAARCKMQVRIKDGKIESMKGFK
ncbi:MAG: putative Lipoprotein-releasing system ATP-binding protein LolD [Candidatus Saccharibacteria bacterium]|nr:putative Lipoprotein-releasing system ATP-binding protein LolD [Candidatus Saccharibacteria bacterium]